MSSQGGFVPATNKQEAVARISSLTNSGPEELGPGSTERKSVLINLSNSLKLGIDTSCTKHELGARIAERLGHLWTSQCQSAGQTVTLTGLNTLLEAATKYLGDNAEESPDRPTPAAEAKLITETIVGALPRYWDGKTCVMQMAEAQSSNWRQTEWQGWYFEFKALPALVNRIGGGPVRIGSTQFDYKRNFIWDLKAHSVFGLKGPAHSNFTCQLNDQTAVRSAIDEGGLGVVVLSGEPTYEGMEFTTWHKTIRDSPGEPKRQLKDAFRPMRLDSFFIQNASSFELALDKKMIIPFKQGRQPDGSLRNPKYSINVQKCIDSDLLVSEYTFD